MVKTVLKAPKTVLDGVVTPDATGPLRTMVNLATLPYQAAKAADRLLEKDENDEASVQTISQLVEMASSAASAAAPPTGDLTSPSTTSGNIPGTGGTQTSPDFARVLTDQLSDPESILRTNASPAVVANLARRFGGSLLLRAAERLQDTHEEITMGHGGSVIPQAGVPLEADEISASVADLASSLATRVVEQVSPEIIPPTPEDVSV